MAAKYTAEERIAAKRESERRSYYKNKARHLAKSLAWSRANREKARAYVRAWHAKNPERRMAIKAKRRAAKLQATPAWADQEAINDIYLEAQINIINDGPRSWHVDHIIPLQGELVCGLHCEDNLQVITEAENLIKNNTFNREETT